MKIIESSSSPNQFEVALDISESELVFPKTNALVHLGIPYTIIFLIILIRSFVLNVIENEITDLVLDPMVLIFIGFTAMIIIGIYYYVLWKNEYQQGIRIYIDFNYNEKKVELRQESDSGFNDQTSIPMNNIRHIVFGRSPYGADGWSCYFQLPENLKSPLFVVNKSGITGMYEFAIKLKAHLKEREKLTLLRFSEPFLKSLPRSIVNK